MVLDRWQRLLIFRVAPGLRVKLDPDNMQPDKCVRWFVRLVDAFVGPSGRAKEGLIELTDECFDDGQWHDQSSREHVAEGERDQEEVEHVLELPFISDRQTDEYITTDGRQHNQEEEQHWPVVRAAVSGQLRDVTAAAPAVVVGV